MEADRIALLTNLDFSTTEDELRAAMGETGKSAHLVNDAENGKSRGMALVALPADRAEALLSEMDGLKVGAKAIRAGYAARSLVFFHWFEVHADECPAALRGLADGAFKRMQEAKKAAEEGDEGDEDE